MTSVSVIVVGHGNVAGLRECLDAVAADLATGDELVLVDNGLAAVPDVRAARVVRAVDNLGFGGGCRLGARSAKGDVLVFVNSDAVVESGTIDSLRATASAPDVGLATGCVVLAETPDRVNSVGNPVHYLGISWAGGHGERVDRHASACDVASVSGALFAARREVWQLLGGMEDSYFLYHEDTELSLRCHLAGLRVVYCPDAVAAHHYVFDRNADKMYLLERNRLRTVLTTYPTGLLVRVLPMVLLTEPLLLALAAARGFGRAKLRSWWWLVAHSRHLAARRRTVQAVSHEGWTALARVLAPRVEQDVTATPAAMRLLNTLLAAYWRLFVRPPQLTGTGAA